MRIRMSGQPMCEGRTYRTACVRPSAVAAVLRPPAPALHQILLGDGGAEAVVVVDEFADEFVHSLLENLVHATVLELGAHRARMALGRPLAPVGAGDVVEVDDEVLVAAR